MYILKCILISLHSAVFPRKNFVKILLLYESPSIRQFVANNAFQKLQYQSQAGYLRKGMNCTSRKFCAQNTVWVSDEMHIICSKKYANIGKMDLALVNWKKPTQKYSSSEKLTQKSGTSTPLPPPPPRPVKSSVEEIVLWFSYEQKFRIRRKLASVMSWR